MKPLVIKNGRVVDPSQKLDSVFDVAIEGGRIREVAADLDGSGAMSLMRQV